MNRLLEILKERWKVENLWQVVLILFIFSITGISALFMKELLFGWMGVGPQTPFLVKSLLWLVTVVPVYQVLFLAYGFLLGQFSFVWNFEKESLRKVKKLFAGTRG